VLTAGLGVVPAISLFLALSFATYGVFKRRLKADPVASVAAEVTLLAPLMKSADAGAETSIYLASSPEVEGISGAYFDNCKMKESSPLSKREDYWQRLWAVSEELTGLRAYA